MRAVLGPDGQAVPDLSGSGFGRGAWVAADHDTLVDSPFELGTFRMHHFSHEGCAFRFAVGPSELWRTGVHQTGTRNAATGR